MTIRKLILTTAIVTLLASKAASFDQAELQAMALPEPQFKVVMVQLIKLLDMQWQVALASHNTSEMFKADREFRAGVVLIYAKYNGAFPEWFRLVIPATSFYSARSGTTLEAKFLQGQ